MSERSNRDIRQAVRESYAKVARGDSLANQLDERKEQVVGQGQCCSPSTEPPASASCCAPSTDTVSSAIGYSQEELASIPEGAVLGLGCGNPVAVADFKPGEVVLDLGSGGGVDCFIAANKVGLSGRAIGVDMTPEMIERARTNADKGGYSNVEFRLGEIEHLPVADSSVDAIISNCVINLAPDKRPVYAEAYRVLTPGGRLAISDIVALKDVPPEIRSNMGLWSCCASGALSVDELKGILQKAGFSEINIAVKEKSVEVCELAESIAPGKGLANLFASAYITAVKPG